MFKGQILIQVLFKNKMKFISGRKSRVVSLSGASCLPVFDEAV